MSADTEVAEGMEGVGGLTKLVPGDGVSVVAPIVESSLLLLDDEELDEIDLDAGAVFDVTALVAKVATFDDIVYNKKLYENVMCL